MTDVVPGRSRACDLPTTDIVHGCAKHSRTEASDG